MNDISFQYVILRNWEGLPFDVSLGEHSDLDLLVYDFSHFFEIFPDAKLEYPHPRVRTRIPIEDSYIYADIRSIGDCYYPEDFQKAILQTREWNERGFFTPDPMHHRIALAYHAVHHKNGISNEYKRWLGDAEIPELLEALKQSNVGWTPTNDNTVGSFYPYWKGATSVVEKLDGWVRKRQTSYQNYNLIKNELEKLTFLDKKHGGFNTHFPHAKENSDSILIEDCGESLTSENIPDTWKNQLEHILIQLMNAGVMHRDIRLDNLMVKDGNIKLIDFGWSKFEDEIDEIEPPSCLGYPNKSSEGFSDTYSMNCVRKQLEYQLEERMAVA